MSTVSRSNWNLEMLVFVQGGKLENPWNNDGKTLGAGMRTNNKLKPLIASPPGFEPRPH